MSLDNNSTIKDFEKYIFSCARISAMAVSALKSSSVYDPTIVMNPEYLAYTIKKGEFSRSELKHIGLGNKQDAKDFCTYYQNENLIKELRENIIKPKENPLKQIGEAGWDCPCYI
ncbi:hypothetical protein KAT36_02785 [Candidatus Pacearchaeota archaeon]|nr:hypothetical protein [Candidatus Pacearchaeota archaeon]